MSPESLDVSGSCAAYCGGMEKRSSGRIAAVAVLVAAAGLAVLTLVPSGNASHRQWTAKSGSDLWATQDRLDGAAQDALAVAGAAYYTDARVNDATRTVDIYLADAPQSVIDQLQSTHTGTYVIHNDAAHPLNMLLQLQHSLPHEVDGMQIVASYVTSGGYLRVGVASTSRSDVRAAQSVLDSLDGAGVIDVYGGAEESGITDDGGLTGPPANSRASIRR
jgi:hypothetical protein